ncbi:hypothetical protein HYDPIDRAFT_28639 [Hydnomerulius pinastri MD-312]|uniref:Uncharacterized protein n=1 Tax=Hydnomerulius pinastri MD-312 TaxID=994086 RepID=A0A0C9WET9_9AGAM|nr:hypothetical protein HYDPIDRAFT_28639 [Hydnomerulius pinastri MD-312]
MLPPRSIAYSIFLISYFPVYSGAVNFTQCLSEVQTLANQTSNSSDLRFDNGSLVPVDSIFNATAITIDACYSQCGTGQEPFDWAVFSQDFAAWLLPYLALISQLPFGARYQVDNLMSALLTVGSPTLAGYSLFLTLLNARWINQQFDSIDFPRRKLRKTVVDVLSSLQQVPLRVHPGEAAFLESLVVLPQNDNWWTTLSDSLNYTHSWSISSATAIAWVVIAYLLTVTDSLSNVADHINSNGQGTGSAWLWLLPIVVGWLVLAPKCAYGRVQHAFEQANQHIVVANAERNALKPNSGITIDAFHNISSPDEARTPPIYNYSRALSWSRSAYITSLLYRSAWRKAQSQIRVDGSAGWQTVPNSRAIHETNRQGNRAQVIAYCQPECNSEDIRWAPGIFSRMVLASLVTLALQWGTTGAAVLAVWYTPTTRLGCRSLAYIIYGAASTISWFLLVLSSLLAHYAMPSFETATSDDPTSTAPIPQLTPSPHPNDTPILFATSSSSAPADTAQTGATQSTSGNIIISVQGATPVATPSPLARFMNLGPELAQQYSPVSPAPGTSQQESMPLLPLNNSPNTPSTPPALQAHTGNVSSATPTATMQFAMALSNYLRWAGKTLAALNAAFIVTISVFQYANFYDRCYCNSSVLSRGSQAYDIVVILYSDVTLARGAWIGALVLASMCSLIFVGTIFLLGDSLPRSASASS